MVANLKFESAYRTPVADRPNRAGQGSPRRYLLHRSADFQRLHGISRACPATSSSAALLKGRSELIGKRVVGEINFACGQCDFCRADLSRHCPKRTVMGILNADGAFAEYVSVPRDNLHVVPDSVSDEEAVFTEPLAAAFEILDQIQVNPGDEVLVLGDGKLGNLCAQVMRSPARR